MPYHVDQNHADCAGYAVVKDGDGEVMGCHDSMASAHAQMAALYAQDDSGGGGGGGGGGMMAYSARGAIAPHSTGTVAGTWDGPAAVAAAPNDATVLRHMHAWFRTGSDPDVKENYKFPHHAASAGSPANLAGVRNALARLPQANIPAGDRAGVERHLQAHLDSAQNSAEPPVRRSGPLGARDRRLLPGEVVARIADAYGEQALAVAHRGFDIDYRGRRLEHRATRGYVELRDAEGSDPVIRGYASVYGEGYDIWGGPPHGFRETVEPGAAVRSINNQDDVYLFFDHEGLPLAATKAGTLTLEDQNRGLYNEGRPDRASPWSMEIVSRIARRELDAMSFAFEVVDDVWSDDFMERSIREVKLYDVSVVSFPANPATVVGLRSSARPKRGMSLALARAEREALALRR